MVFSPLLEEKAYEDRKGGRRSESEKNKDKLEEGPSHVQHAWGVDISNHGNATFTTNNEEKSPSNEEKLLDTSLLSHLCNLSEFVTN